MRRPKSIIFIVCVLTALTMTVVVNANMQIVEKQEKSNHSKNVKVIEEKDIPNGHSVKLEITSE